jgi:hypothetical protein
MMGDENIEINDQQQNKASFSSACFKDEDAYFDGEPSATLQETIDMTQIEGYETFFQNVAKALIAQEGGVFEGGELAQINKPVEEVEEV